MEPWQRALHARQLTNLEGKLRKMKASRDYFRRRCEILESIVNEIDPSLLPPRGAPSQERFFRSYMAKTMDSEIHLAGPETFCASLTREMSENSTRQPQGRRWSLPMLFLTFVLRSLGSKAYDYFRWFVPLPCKQTLLSHFGKSMDSWSRRLLEVNELTEVCALFRRRHLLPDNELVHVCLGIDAMSMDPVVYGPNGSLCNHVFLFELLPLSGRMKPLPIHLMPFPSGNARRDVLCRIDELVSILTRLNFVVRFIAADGDSGYNIIHERMYLSWINIYNRKGLDEVIEALDGMNGLIVGDLLHLLKNARSKILKGRVSVFGDGSFSFDASDLERVLNLGRALTDISSKGECVIFMFWKYSH